MTDKAIPTKTPSPKPKGRTLQDFRAAHDKAYIIPRKVEDAIKALGSSWEYEIEFLRRAGLSTNDLARCRAQFEDHIVTIAGRNPKRVWAGTPALAKQLREMLE